MKEFLKKIYLNSGVLFDTIVSIISIVLFSKYSSCREIEKLRNNRRHSMATMLANGPSAKEICCSRRDLLEDTDIIAMNKFGISDYFFIIKPRYYIFIDPRFFNSDYEETQTEINSANWDVFRELQDNFSKIDWDMILIIPNMKNTKKAHNMYARNPHITPIHVNCTRVIGFKWLQNWAYKKGLGVPTTYNVSVPAIQILINAGYKKIYLYGVEFSWTKTMDVDVDTGLMYFKDDHLYHENKNLRTFGRGGYEVVLSGILTAIKGMNEVAKYAESCGVKIINRTKGSFIDCFDYENPDKF